MSFNQVTLLSTPASGETSTYTPTQAGFVVGNVLGQDSVLDQSYGLLSATSQGVTLNATAGNWIWNLNNIASTFVNMEQSFCLPVSANTEFTIGYVGTYDDQPTLVYFWWIPLSSSDSTMAESSEMTMKKHLAEIQKGFEQPQSK